MSYVSCIGRRVLYHQCHLRSNISYIYTYRYLDSEESACNARDLGLMPGKGMAPHSSILFWRIPWTEEPWTQGQWDTVDWVAESDMTDRLCVCVYIYIYIYIYTPRFIYSSINGHLGCFLILAIYLYIVNNAAVNKGGAVQISFQVSAFIFFGKIPRSGIARSYGSHILIF